VVSVDADIARPELDVECDREFRAADQHVRHVAPTVFDRTAARLAGLAFDPDRRAVRLRVRLVCRARVPNRPFDDRQAAEFSPT
jgi:hypothetical protein